MNPADPTHSDLLASARALVDVDPGEADRLADRVLQRHRGSVEALEIRAAAAFRAARYDAALTFLRRCVKARPREPRFHARLAEVLTADGRFGEALEAIDRMGKACPGARVSGGQVARLHRMRGDRAAAARVLEAEARAGRCGPELDLERAELALAGGDDATAESLALRAATVGQGPPGPVARRAWFAAGAARERQGNWAGAFEAWERANTLADAGFDSAAFEARVQAIIETWSVAVRPQLARSEGVPRRALLIVGLPRSGTSLVEQVLDCHPDVAGGGELPDLTRAARELEGFPAAAAHLDGRSATAIGRGYTDRLRRIAPRARFVTNKNLDLHELLGLVWQVLPDTPVIRVDRDPADTAVSCFASNLQPGSHPWASAPESIAQAFRAFERLMAHWSIALDLPMAHVRYEELVAEPEPVVRGLLESLGLPFDERCLRHHESRRTAATLSADQVRRPMYTSSIGRAQHFPAFTALDYTS